jgi:hypothetical protein
MIQKKQGETLLPAKVGFVHAHRVSKGMLRQCPSICSPEFEIERKTNINKIIFYLF